MYSQELVLDWCRYATLNSTSTHTVQQEQQSNKQTAQERKQRSAGNEGYK